MDKNSRKIICTAFSNSKRDDYKLFKTSKIKILESTKIITDFGYQGLKKVYKKTEIPKKKNQQISKNRMANENLIGMLKKNKIITDK